jgi:hypothetical protein
MINLISTWWSTGFYNIIVIHICCTGLKIVGDLKAAEILSEKKDQAAPIIAERWAAGL